MKMRGFDVKNYAFEPGEHKGKNVIWIVFSYNPHLISALKENTTAKWSRSTKKWYVPDNTHYRKLLGLEPLVVGKSVVKNIHPNNLPALSRLLEQLKL